MTAGATARTLRVLVIEDGVAVRGGTRALLESLPAIDVVGTASTNEEALRLGELIAPDLVVMDLALPRGDPFAILRLLHARRHSTVLVVGTEADPEGVFKALELGALDFVTRRALVDASALRAELAEKIAIVREMRAGGAGGTLRSTTTGNFPMMPPGAPVPTPVVPLGVVPPERSYTPVVVVTAATGGPQAVVDLVGRTASVPRRAAIVLALAMTSDHARVFAERLQRRTGVAVRSAAGCEPLDAGAVVLVASDRESRFERDAHGAAQLVTMPAPAPLDSGALLASAASALGARTLAVALSGPASALALDGFQAVYDAGGTVWAESPESAISPGNPAVVCAAGLASETLVLGAMVMRLAQYVSGPRG